MKEKFGKTSRSPKYYETDCRTKVTHFRNSNFKRKMKRMQIPQKFVHEKFYVHEIVAVNLLKIYFLKNAKKTCKANNHELNRD